MNRFALFLVVFTTFHKSKKSLNSSLNYYISNNYNILVKVLLALVALFTTKCIRVRKKWDTKSENGRKNENCLTWNETKKMAQLSFFDLPPREKKSEPVFLNVAVKSDIYKFIYWKEKVPPGTVLPLNKRYSIIMDILKNNIAKNHHIRGNLDSLDNYTKFLKISIHMVDVPYHRFLQSPSSIKCFNTMMYKLMMDSLHEKIRLNLILGKPERITVHEFMDEIGLEDEDIGYDSLLKSSQRYRQEMGIGTIEDLKRTLVA